MEIDGERGMARGGKVYCDGTVGSKNQKQTSFALFTCDNLGACVCVCLERVLVLVWLLAFVCVWVALALPPFMFLFCFSRLPPSGAT